MSLQESDTSFISTNATLKHSIFTKLIPQIGAFSIRPMNLSEDINIIYDWVNLDYAKFWAMGGTSLQEFENNYKKILLQSRVYIGLFNNSPAFLLECYPPEVEIIGKHYKVQQGDVGMHILVGPAKKRIHQFTWAVFRTIMDFLFSKENVNRIVVEPDVRNEKIHLLNKRAGFIYQRTLELPSKKAYLGFCTREQYTSAIKF